MGLTREVAWAKLCDWTEGESLRKHARAVEIVMRAAAERYGAGAADLERWGIAGMLHDADYERWPEDHPKRIVAWLEEGNEPEIAYAVSAHYTQWKVPHRTALDRALLACDELTGLIIAVARLRPNRLQDLTPKSVKKKLKDKNFAKGVDREEVRIGMELLDVDPTEHISFIIEALRPHENEVIV